MITREEFQEWKTTDSLKRKSNIEDAMICAIDDVLQAIFKPKKNKWSWWFDGAEEGQIGDIERELHSCFQDDDIIWIVLGKEVESPKNYEWNGFLFKWLFMTPEKVLSEIDIEIQKELQQKKLKSLKNKESLEKKNTLILSALKKLNSNELKALGWNKKRIEKIEKSLI